LSLQSLDSRAVNTDVAEVSKDIEDQLSSLPNIRPTRTEGLAGQRPDWPQLSSDDLRDYRQIIAGLACAFSHGGSYGLAVHEARAFGGVAPWLAGLVSGAWGGTAALPIRWQVVIDTSWSKAAQPSMSTVMSEKPTFENPIPANPISENTASCQMMAVALYAQWAGQSGMSSE
ncbi:MAG: hypothetical protein AAFU53_12695, partial [Cyanobacteria bacterium J06632_3]